MNDDHQYDHDVYDHTNNIQALSDPITYQYRHTQNHHQSEHHQKRNLYHSKDTQYTLAQFKGTIHSTFTTHCTVYNIKIWQLHAYHQMLHCKTTRDWFMRSKKGNGAWNATTVSVNSYTITTGS